jgi:hypothetical protein
MYSSAAGQYNKSQQPAAGHDPAGSARKRWFPVQERAIMSSLMWLMFILMLALLVLSLIWLVWKLRNFSQSQNQTYLDDKLMQAMLSDAVLSKKVKQALVKQAGGTTKEEEVQPEEGEK